VIGAQFRSDVSSDLRALWSFGGTVTSEGEVAHRMSGDEV